MTDWDMQVTIHILVGYQMNVMVTLFYGGQPVNVALFMLSFFFYTAGVVILAVEKAKNCSRKQAGIVLIVLLVVSVVLTIISLIIWSPWVPTYQGALAVLSAFMAALAIVFRLIKIIESCKTSPVQ